MTWLHQIPTDSVDPRAWPIVLQVLTTTIRSATAISSSRASSRSMRSARSGSTRTRSIRARFSDWVLAHRYRLLRAARTRGPGGHSRDPPGSARLPEEAFALNLSQQIFRVSMPRVAGHWGLIYSWCKLWGKGEANLLKLLEILQASGLAIMRWSCAAPLELIVSLSLPVTACRRRHFAPRVNQTPLQRDKGLDGPLSWRRASSAKTSCARCWRGR